MLVDAVPSTVTLSPLPEDYRFHLYLEDFDLPHSNIVLDIFNGLLSPTGTASGEYSMSLYDMLEFHKKLKAINMGQWLRLTEKTMAVMRNHFETIRLIEEIKSGKWNDSIPDGLLKSTLWTDQKAAVALHLALGISGNWFSVGLGKTLITLYWFAVLLQQSKARKLVIFCLNENKTTWEAEIKKHTAWIDETVVVGNGTKQVLDDIDRFASGDYKILICHYEGLAGAPQKRVYGKKTRERKTNFNPRNSKIVVALSSLMPSTIVCDEAHILKNIDSKRTKCVLSVFAESIPKNVVFTTATPVSESPLDAYALLKIMRPQILPAKTRFDNHFCNTWLMPVKRKNKQGKKVPTGQKIKILNKKNPWKNLPELTNLTRIYGFRKTHEDVEGMPPVQDFMQTVQLSGAQLDLYKKIADETYEEIAAMPQKALNLDVAAVKTIRLRQVLTAPIILDEKVESCKLLMLDNLVEQHMADRNNKLLIWSSFKPACDEIAERYKELGAAAFHGDITRKTLVKREADFIEGDNPRILVCTPDKAGTGKNLQRARMDIWVDRPVRFLHYDQARGRIERRGAVGTSVHITLHAPGTIDEWVEEILRMKGDVQYKILEQDPEQIAKIQIERADLLGYIRGLVA